MFASKSRTRTAGGSEIIYRAVHTEGAGSGKKVVPIPLAVVTTKDGTVYEVPVDPKTGKVPQEAIIAHFLDFENWTDPGHLRSPGKDRRETATKLIKIPPKGITPEEIVACGWWPRPNESDIFGIDDQENRDDGYWSKLPKSAGTVPDRLQIVGPEDERQRVIQILTAQYRGRELKAAVKHRGLIVKIANPGKNLLGYYRCAQRGFESPMIVLRPGFTEETLIHEFTHHLRFGEAGRDDVIRTPFNVDDTGYRLDSVLEGPAEKDMSNLEEAATVAETTARVSHITKPDGYYSLIPGKSNDMKLYAEDRETLTRNSDGTFTPKKGKAARDAVKERFADTNISGLKKKGTKKDAITVADELRDSGRMTSSKGKSSKGKSSKAASASKKGKGAKRRWQRQESRPRGPPRSWRRPPSATTKS